MAIKVSGTTVIDNSRQLSNIASIDSTTSSTLKAAGLGASTNLFGDPNVYSEQVVTFSITNFRIDGTYTVAVGTGSAIISGQNVIYTAPNITSDSTTTLTVTVTLDGNAVDTAYSLNLKPRAVLKPTLTVVGGTTNVNLLNRTYNGSAFEFAGGTDTHASTDWQVATDSNFSNLIVNINDTTTDLTSYNDTYTLTADTNYYVRVRYNSNTYSLTSEWSDTVVMDSAGGQVTTPTTTFSNGTWTGSAYAVTGTQPNGDTHESSSWYVYSDSGGSNLLGSVLNSTTNKTSIGFGDFSGVSFTDSTVYYVKVVYNSSTLGASNASPLVSGTYINTISSSNYPGGTVYNNSRGVIYKPSSYQGASLTASFTYRYFMDGSRITVMGGGGGSKQTPVIGGGGSGGGYVTYCNLDASAAGLSDGDTVTITVGNGGSGSGGSYCNYASCHNESVANRGCTSSFGSLVSATGGYPGTAMWEGGRGGWGSTGGGGSGSVNSGKPAGCGGFNGCCCGRGQDVCNDICGDATSPGMPHGPHTNPSYNTWFATPGCYCGGAGGCGCQPNINSVVTYVTGATMNQTGGYANGGGTTAPGAVGGTGVIVSGVPYCNAPTGNASPNYGPAYTICGACGFGAGGRGGMGDAGGGAGGSLTPGSPGSGGFVAIEWG